MEFCKDRVFTAVNADELKPGDKVITANCMADLKTWVQSNDNAREILLIHDDTNLARFEIKGLSGSYISALAYLVERVENCTNCENLLSSTEGECSCKISPRFVEYRTKPIDVIKTFLLMLFSDANRLK